MKLSKSTVSARPEMTSSPAAVSVEPPPSARIAPPPQSLHRRPATAAFPAVVASFGDLRHEGASRVYKRRRRLGENWRPRNLCREPVARQRWKESRLLLTARRNIARLYPPVSSKNLLKVLRNIFVFLLRQGQAVDSRDRQELQFNIMGSTEPTHGQGIF